jgi:uncharacterized protein (DUF1697 family)
VARYVVLLRGINVGKAKRVAMAELRDLLADLGYTDVRTHLNSGNAVVTGRDADTAEQAERLEAAIRERFGMDVRCVVLTADELRAIVDGHPFVDIADNGSRMMANILSAPLDPTLLAEHNPIALDPDRARLGERVIYQWCPNTVLEAPPVGGFVEMHLGVAVTARNWNTITKLAELLERP